MATCRTTVPAPPEVVFDLLLDPFAFPEWVVGAHKIRGVDDDWPSVGSAFHHESGPWFARHRDRTELVRAERPGLVEFRAFARPTGAARVRLTLRPHADGTEVTLDEQPIGGIVKLIWNPLLDALLHARNQESLRRLRALVLSRRGARDAP